MHPSILDLNGASIKLSITRIENKQTHEISDWIAREEPLEIKIRSQANPDQTTDLNVTMRTPGNDFDLIRGFLFTEGIIRQKKDLVDITYDLDLPPHQQRFNSVIVTLEDHAMPNIDALNRHFYTTSSCGVCGKASLDMVMTKTNFKPQELEPAISRELFSSFPELLSNAQGIFDQTGGIHAAGLFDLDGNFVHSEEDIGRHNAVDKLVGWAVEQDLIPLREHILVVSGRAGFELVQKAVMVGLSYFASIGAASSLAIELARQNNITMIGFLSKSKFNVYSGSERIKDL